MSLFGMININDERREHKTARVSEKETNKRDYGYFVYEALEYGSDNKNASGFGMPMELLKSFVR